MLNLIKIIFVVLISIFLSVLLSPIFIVLKLTKKWNWKQIKKLYKLWLKK